MNYFDLMQQASSNFQKKMTDVLCTQAINQKSSSETDEGQNTADGSSDGEEGHSVEEEEEKDKLKGDKTGCKQKKVATSKVIWLFNMLTWYPLSRVPCSWYPRQRVTDAESRPHSQHYSRNVLISLFN